ncbi:hypothetical protein KI440_01595 [Candidatus Saccharibacteria bacterium TM7i]|nr:hypothetical protein KI440_01595 [Candidatus Saccharibacteria bacterium TM7i]
MTTPRSEAIMKFRSHESTIRPPQSADDIENRGDHYAVLAQVINTGVSEYLDGASGLQDTAAAETLKDVSATLSKKIQSSIFATLHSKSYAEHLANLTASQTRRVALDRAKWDTVELTIMAGTSTFINSAEGIFRMLNTTLGTEVAAHTDNWRILDKLAKLDIYRFSAYYNTYLTQPDNWTHALEHLESSRSGGIEFVAGYPNNAEVPVAVTQKDRRGILTREDCDITNGQPTIALKDVNIQPAIGCPVTFEPSIVRRLWGLYAESAQRVTVSSFDGSEASPR